MKFLIKVEAEIVITAEGIMQANTVWKRLRKEGKPYLIGDCYSSVCAPDHDYRDRQRHRACVESRIVSMTKMERMADAPRTTPNQKADVAPATGAHVQRVVGQTESRETK